MHEQIITNNGVRLSPIRTHDCCSDFKPMIDKINSFINIVSVRSGKNLYNGKPFEYCPWCGSKIDRDITDA